MNKFVVYQISINGTARYVGRTTVDRLSTRQKEHNKAFKAGLSKPFYNWLRTINCSGELVLEPIYLAKTKLLCKQYEAYTILWYKFGTDTLKQKVPSISDR